MSENSHRRVVPVALYMGIARKCMDSDCREVEGLGLGMLHSADASHKSSEWRMVL